MNEEQKVWLVETEWSEGRRFEHETYNEVFDNEESARKELDLLKEEAFECFRNIYDEDYIIIEDFKSSSEVHTEDYGDFWSGCISQRPLRH